MTQDAKTVVDAFILAVSERPDDFHISERTLTDTRSRMQFWISNGFSNYGVWAPFKLDFGRVQGWRFSRYVNRLKAWKAANALVDKQPPNLAAHKAAREAEAKS